MSSVSHLAPAKGWSYHPFGVVLYPVLVVLALAAVVRPVRRLVEATMTRWPRVCTWLVWGTIIGLVMYGVIRWL